MLYTVCYILFVLWNIFYYPHCFSKILYFELKIHTTVYTRLMLASILISLSLSSIDVPYCLYNIVFTLKTTYTTVSLIVMGENQVWVTDPGVKEFTRDCGKEQDRQVCWDTLLREITDNAVGFHWAECGSPGSIYILIDWSGWLVQGGSSLKIWICIKDHQLNRTSVYGSFPLDFPIHSLDPFKPFQLACWARNGVCV